MAAAYPAHPERFKPDDIKTVLAFPAASV